MTRKLVATYVHSFRFERNHYRCLLSNNAGDDDDDTDVDAHAETTYHWILFSLIFGLWADVTSAVILSVIYRSPLDIKSVHKIPADDDRNCGGTFIVLFLAPFSWALICFSVGYASIQFADNSSCGGNGGSGLRGYLMYSGVFLAILSALLLVLSSIIICFSCGTPMRCVAGCCNSVRHRIHSMILSKAPYLDLWWQLQGVIWSYRTGSFSLGVAILTGMTGVFGEVLALLGSCAPESVQELVGPIMSS